MTRKSSCATWLLFMTMIKRLFFVLLFVSISGCQTVAPWEREVLAKEEMSWIPDPLEQTLENQIYFSKEAASGGLGSAGGGCGCN